MAAARQVDLGDAQELEFSRMETRDYLPGDYGVKETPEESETYDKVVARPYIHERGGKIDKSDLVGSDRDLLSDIMASAAGAKARLMDRAILNGIVKPALVASAPAANTDQSYGANRGHTEEFRDIACFHDGQAASAADLSSGTDFSTSADVIDKIGYIFRRRDVALKDICVTLTPELRRLLGQDAQFISNQNIYYIDEGAKVYSSYNAIQYKGVALIDTSENALPFLGSGNISSESAATDLVTPRKVRCKALRTQDGSVIIDASRKSSQDAANDNASSTHAQIDVQSKDMIYAWHKKAVVLCTRLQDTDSYVETSPLLRGAYVWYSRVLLDSIVRDDDFVLAVAIQGTVTTAVS